MTWRSPLVRFVVRAERVENRIGRALTGAEYERLRDTLRPDPLWLRQVWRDYWCLPLEKRRGMIWPGGSRDLTLRELATMMAPLPKR